MGKFKRELVPGAYLTAADMLSVLSQQQFKAAALDGQILLAVQPPVAWLLDSCCVGRAGTQQQAAAGEQPPPPGDDSNPHDCGNSSSHSSHMLERVVSLAGINCAAQDLQEQYTQHQQQLLAQQQRKASRAGRRAAASAAIAAAGLLRQQQQQAEGAGSEGVVCLVQLSFEEAVFLSHVLQCCKVLCASSSSSTSQPDSGAPAAGAPAAVTAVPTVLTSSQLWQWCCRHSTGGAGVFAPQYAAYHHLRCLGWLPLPGLTYGADYVLYQLHPELAHSDFVVTVMLETREQHAASSKPGGATLGAAGAAAAAGRSKIVEQQPRQEAAAALPALPDESSVQQRKQGLLDQRSQQQQECDGGEMTPHSSQLAWLDACIMQRLARQVLKEMMLLYVVVPEGLSLLEFECIDSMQVREVLVQRWVPAEHREG